MSDDHSHSNHVNVLDKQLTLVLNSVWSVIGIRTVKEAVVALCSEANGQHPALALDMETSVDENGDVVIVNAIPTAWEQWCELPIRENDLFISAAHGKRIRVPTVIVAVNYSKMPIKRVRWSTGNVLARDNLICGYTGKKMSRREATVDHIIPKSRGGTDSWLNTVACLNTVNQSKADRTPSEAGLKLLRQPTEPPALPASAMIREAAHSTWIPFLVS